LYQVPGTSAGDNISVSTTDKNRESYRDEQSHLDNVDAGVIPDDYHIPLDTLQDSFAPGWAMDPATISLDDIVRHSQDQDSLTDNLVLPLCLDGESVLAASRQASPNLGLATASTASVHCSNKSSKPSSPSQHVFLFNAGGIHESTPPPDSAESSASETLHARLVAVHHQLTTLSESLAVSFNMVQDVEKVYRMSRHFKAVVDSYQTRCSSYPPVPIVKCHGMTAPLILGCYSYIMEAFEFLVEKLQPGMQPSSDADTSASASGTDNHCAQSEPPQITLPSSMIPHINVGSVRIPISSELTAEIHKRHIHQTAQDLKGSLRQCVRGMAAAQYVALDVNESDDTWNPIAKLTELCQRELQRRENGISMYLSQGLRTPNGASN
jgi:hypothetical protein